MKSNLNSLYLALFGLICILALASWVSRPAEAQTPTTRPKFEYKTEIFEVARGQGGQGGQSYENMLNNLAAHGWEFDGILIPPYDSKDRTVPTSVVVFRREKQ